MRALLNIQYASEGTMNYFLLMGLIFFISNQVCATEFVQSKDEKSLIAVFATIKDQNGKKIYTIEQKMSDVFEPFSNQIQRGVQLIKWDKFDKSTVIKSNIPVNLVVGCKKASLDNNLITLEKNDGSTSTIDLKKS